MGNSQLVLLTLTYDSNPSMNPDPFYRVTSLEPRCMDYLFRYCSAKLGAAGTKPLKIDLSYKHEHDSNTEGKPSAICIIKINDLAKLVIYRPPSCAFAPYPHPRKGAPFHIRDVANSILIKEKV
jgi:hypothetical protein